jgi:hypothetical protein
MAFGNNLSPILQCLELEPLLRGGGKRGGMNRQQALTVRAGMAARDGASAAFSCLSAA